MNRFCPVSLSLSLSWSRIVVGLRERGTREMKLYYESRRRCELVKVAEISQDGKISQRCENTPIVSREIRMSAISDY